MAHRVVITGGAGFIGSNIVARLCARSDLEVVVVDRLRTAQSGKWRNLAKHPIADLIAPEDFASYLAATAEPIAAVIHMGAISATTETDVDKIMAANLTLSKQVWSWCTDHRRPLIYASSAATYGDGAEGFCDTNDMASVAALRPLNAYGFSKKLFDLYALRAADKGMAPPMWSGLRFFNVYGPNEYHKGGQKSVVAHLAPKIAAGEPVTLFKSHRPGIADGEQSRDFVAVWDCVDVIEWLLAGERHGGLLNIGSGQARSFLDLAKAAFAAHGKTPDIGFIETPEAIRANYQYFTQADLSRLRDLGYDRQMTPLEAGVTRYVRDHLMQADPYA